MFARYLYPLTRHLGHRGAFLLLFGVIWILVGVSLLPDTETPMPPHVLMLFEHLPLWLRIAYWMAPGTVAVVSAFLRGPGHDTAGFALLIVAPIVRGGSYGWAWVAWMLSGGQIGEDRGWLGAVVWAALAGAILIVASWREPGGFVPHLHEGDGDTPGAE